MAPNPEFHNGKRPEDNSFVNIAFTADDVPPTATDDDDVVVSPADSAADSPHPPLATTHTGPASVLTNRRNSSGNNNSNGTTESSKSKSQHETNNQKLSPSHTGKSPPPDAAGDANNNNNNDKAMVSCGSELQKEELMDFDDLLPYIGEFGRYQKILFLLMIPFAFFVAWTYFSQIFLTLVPQEFHCALPELDAFSALSPGER